MKRLIYISLLLLIAIAFAMRAYPVLTNTASSYWHDENNYIEQALRLGSGNFQLITFVHGGLFYLILLLGYAAYYLVGFFAGLFPSPSALYLKYLNDPSVFFVIARLTSVISGTAIVYVMYRITYRIYRCQRIAFVAALFSAFSLIMIQMSFFALADIPSVFLLSLALLALVVSIDSPDDRRYYYIACLLVGLATACKYYTVFGIVPLYVGAFIKSRGFTGRTGRFFRFILLGSLLACIGFCIGMPFFLFNVGKLVRDTFVNMGSEYILKNPNKYTWLFYFTNHLRNGLGLPLEALGLCGIGYALYKRSKWDMVLVSFPIAYYLLFMHSMGFAYHVLPAIPFILILAARFLDVICRKFFPKFPAAAFMCLSIAAIAPTAADSIKFAKIVASPDTRVMAKAWAQEHIPQGAKILGEGYLATIAIHSPSIAGDAKTLSRDLAHVVKTGGSGLSIKTRVNNFDRLYGKARTYDIYKVERLSEADVTGNDPEYIILTGDNDNLTGAELSYYAPADLSAQRQKLRAFVSADYDLMRSFSPSDEMTAWFPHLVDHDYALLRKTRWDELKDYARGPRIDIYRRNTGALAR